MISVRFASRLIRLILLIQLLSLAPVSAWAGDAVVRAVLFYSPTCPHCHEVIDKLLKPMLKKYGENLHIHAVDVRESDGRDLYLNAVRRFNVGKDRMAVPTIIVGNRVLVGGEEIPQQFPLMVEQGIKEGGLDWSDIPGLQQRALIAGPGAEKWLSAHISDGPLQRFARDPVGNGLAVLVLVLLLAALLHSRRKFIVELERTALPERPSILAALVILVGAGIAAYMAYVETAQVAAACGPVGDCNAVQQSEYAKLFGIPLGVIGVLGYATLLLAWLLGYFASGKLAALACFGLFGMALAGTLFSIYLTFLEPFVIGATCAWCLGSAICMGLLLMLTRQPAAAAWRRLL